MEDPTAVMKRMAMGEGRKQVRGSSAEELRRALAGSSILPFARVSRPLGPQKPGGRGERDRGCVCSDSGTGPLFMCVLCVRVLFANSRARRDFEFGDEASPPMYSPRSCGGVRVPQ